MRDLTRHFTSIACALGLLVLAPATSHVQNQADADFFRAYAADMEKMGQEPDDATSDVAINTQASISDGEMTWLQFGASGAKMPNALVTVSPDEVGIAVGRGKWIATAGAEACTGKMVVSFPRSRSLDFNHARVAGSSTP